MQDKPLRRDPFTGQNLATPISAAEARMQMPHAAWLFDPWSGRRRNAGDVFTDPQGMLIAPVEPIEPPADAGGMSMFANEADYWRHLSEYLANELQLVAFAMGISRTSDIRRQICRIRSAQTIDEATRIVDSMNVGEIVIASGQAAVKAKQMESEASELEKTLAIRLITKKLGSLPEDWEERVLVRVNASSQFVEIWFDGEHLTSTLPPRLVAVDKESDDKTVAVNLILEHYEQKPEEVQP